MNKKLLYIFIFLLFFITSCKKSEDSPIKPNIPDNPSNPVIDEKDPSITLGKDTYVIGEHITFTTTNSNLDDYIITYDNPLINKISDSVYQINRTGTYEFRALCIQDNNEFCLNVNVYNNSFNIVTTSPSLNINEYIEFWIDDFDELYEQSVDDFTFTVSDEKLALIEGNKIKAIASGDIYIKATSKHNPLVTSLKKITINSTENDTFVISEQSTLGHLSVGDEVELNISKGIAGEFEWLTSNSEVIRVTKYDTKICVTAVGEGNALISCYNRLAPEMKSSYYFSVKGISDTDYITRILDLAYAEVGVKETGNNIQKYGEWYGNNGQPWCATFVSWCWYHAGLSNDLLLKYQGCSTGKEWCVQQGIFKYKESYTPKSGDIVFFLSSGASHTGIVAYCDGEYIYTIEGNRSNKVGVWRLSVNNKTITGYAVPKYPKTTKVVDYSFIKTEKINGSYIWTQVTNGEPTV